MRMTIIAPLFALFGIMLGLGFFANGTTMDPTSAIQQQVQYLSWIIFAVGSTIFALSFVMALLYQILQELKRLGPSSAFTAPAATSPAPSP
jgi:hypothetical protein